MPARLPHPAVAARLDEREAEVGRTVSEVHHPPRRSRANSRHPSNDPSYTRPMSPAQVPMYDVAMRRLATTVRLLGVLLAAVVARCITEGPDLVLGVTLVFGAAVFVAAVLLRSQGHRRKPSRDSALRPQRS